MAALLSILTLVCSICTATLPLVLFRAEALWLSGAQLAQLTFMTSTVIAMLSVTVIRSLALSDSGKAVRILHCAH